MTAIQTFNGECLEVMRGIPDGSVDMVLCDLPYGVTDCAWDVIIPFPDLWAAYSRVCKPNAAIVLTAIQPFTSAAVMSNPKWFKYSWIWRKDNATGFLNAKKQPLRNHEDILVFYKEQPVYNPRMEAGKPYKCRSGSGGGECYAKKELVHTANLDGERYPKTVLEFTRDPEKVHPTQKPVALMEYMIRTYTNPGNVVLDNTMGSGTTGVAAVKCQRGFIGIEMDEKHFRTAENRIKGALRNRRLFL